MDKNVIIVTVNYRLGPLGFLSLGNDMVPGNNGFRDQNLALKWVQENIEDFGGNPDSVTLFGESAGSYSVAVHLVSPLSKGLFQKAILQSGTTLNPAWHTNTPERATQFGIFYAEKLNCHNESDILQCLQDKPLDEIMAETDLMDKGVVWLDVVDANLTTSDPVLPDYPESLLSSGQFHTNVEIIIGTTADEGVLFLAEEIKNSAWNELKTKLETEGPKMLLGKANVSEITDADLDKSKKIVEFYIKSFDNVNEDNLQSLVNMYTDAMFLYGTHKTVNYLLQNNVKVYQYLLSYQGQFSFTQLFGLEPLGTAHADDLIYMWDPVFR